MNVAIVEVEQVGDSGIVVIFSNGTRGRYSAALLAFMSEASQRPAPIHEWPVLRKSD